MTKMTDWKTMAWIGAHTIEETAEHVDRAEAALRKAEEALLSGAQMDGLGERYAIDGAPLIEALAAIRVYFREYSLGTPGRDKP